MVRSRFALKFVLIIVSFSVFASCSSKSVVINFDPTLDARQVLNRAMLTTPNYCGYKGGVVAKVQSETDSQSIKGLLSKQCSGDYRFVVLGVLNAPMAEIISNDGEIKVVSSDISMSEHIRLIAGRYAESISQFIETPLTMPKTSPTLEYSEIGYVLVYNRGFRVTVDENFYIIKYTFSEDTFVEYVWEDDVVKSIILTINEEVFTLKFQSDTGWI